MSNHEQAIEFYADMNARAAEMEQDFESFHRVMEERDQEVPSSGVASQALSRCQVVKTNSAQLELETMRMIQEMMA